MLKRRSLHRREALDKILRTRINELKLVGKRCCGDESHVTLSVIADHSPVSQGKACWGFNIKLSGKLDGTAMTRSCLFGSAALRTTLHRVFESAAYISVEASPARVEWIRASGCAKQCICGELLGNRLPGLYSSRPKFRPCSSRRTSKRVSCSWDNVRCARSSHCGDLA